jgi:hypothetical protein
VIAVVGGLAASGALTWFGSGNDDPGNAGAQTSRTAGAQIPGSTRPSDGAGSGPGSGSGGGAPPPSASVGPRRPAGFEGPASTDLVKVDSPLTGQAVPLCTIITGTSKLPAGRTLMTSVERVKGGDRIRHLQTVRAWRRPAELRTWQGVQFIGLPDDPVGGKYRIEVFVVPLASLLKQIEASGGERSDWRAQLPAKSVVAATVFVTRAAGNNDPEACAKGPR